MKAEFQKIFKLFKELEEAGKSATLTMSSKNNVAENYFAKFSKQLVSKNGPIQ